MSARGRERARSSRGLQERLSSDGFHQVNCAWRSPLRHSLHRHSQRLVFRLPARRSFIFLRSLRSTVITRFVATTDALTPSRAVLRLGFPSMNSVTPGLVSLITAFGLPAILSPTIGAVSKGCGGLLQAALPLPEGLTLRDRLRRSLAGSPTVADRIEFTLSAHHGGRRYGLAVLVPLLSTPCFHDAVTVRYLTALHRMEADFHHFNQTPSQAHERSACGRITRSTPHGLLAEGVKLRFGPQVKLVANQRGCGRDAFVEIDPVQNFRVIAAGLEHRDFAVERDGVNASVRRDR